MEELLDSLTYLKWGFLAFQIFFVAIVVAVVRVDSLRKMIGEGTVLFVTAHPDDESMFFLPTIVSLAGSHSLHLLSLSTGNADGLGRVREKELLRAGSLLRFAHTSALDDPRLQDGMTTQWDPAVVSEVVQSYIDSHNISTVITFDSQGVSGHTNHRAVHAGIKGTPKVKKFELQSTGLFRKYLGLADLVLSLSEDILFLNVSVGLAWRAMATHHSQFVWYRKLFVLFSRYGYLNTLRPLAS